MSPTPPNASSLVTFGLPALAVLVVIGFAWALRAQSRALAIRFALVAAGWGALTLGLAAAGVFANVERRPPPLLLLPIGLGIGIGALARSRIGAALANVPLWLLVGLQSFRFPLELVMHQAAVEGTMPVQMTFGAGGLNYDIVTGVSALLLAVALRRGPVPRGVVLAWNVMGSLLLLTIVTVAILSTPLFAKFGTEPAVLNTWVLFAPFVWLPAVLVGSAALGHVVLFRALLAPPVAVAPQAARVAERPA